MIKPVKYSLYTADGDRSITIKPGSPMLPGSTTHVTGVFKLSEGHVDLGEIVFDDSMHQWEYTGLGDLTHEQAGEIATYIKDKIRRELEGNVN
ncbi:hypothetical protein SNE25_27420 [Mucilaginibacter sabulilitoris]|uniref:Phage protein n=1 Tax=Mucilaginibacter sabulilitoris TaxID=1173583 RepID=A0ABZ0TJR5_9SPHI|nr:hypothetical protein [Mucilaginibacter sabulilitoris]WPU93054.1 hypothetical protein SNE25_27420 [Mucilaginibacter sabulilitoris]